MEIRKSKDNIIYHNKSLNNSVTVWLLLRSYFFVTVACVATFSLLCVAFADTLERLINAL